MGSKERLMIMTNGNQATNDGGHKGFVFSFSFSSSLSSS
jgi:hypothetical protein